jgi:hypothetical protein
MRSVGRDAEEGRCKRPSAVWLSGAPPRGDPRRPARRSGILPSATPRRHREHVHARCMRQACPRCSTTLGLAVGCSILRQRRRIGGWIEQGVGLRFDTFIPCPFRYFRYHPMSAKRHRSLPSRRHRLTPSDAQEPPKRLPVPDHSPGCDGSGTLECDGRAAQLRRAACRLEECLHLVDGSFQEACRPEVRIRQGPHSRARIELLLKEHQTALKFATQSRLNKHFRRV